MHNRISDGIYGMNGGQFRVLIGVLALCCGNSDFWQKMSIRRTGTQVIVNRTA